MPVPVLFAWIAANTPELMAVRVGLKPPEEIDSGTMRPSGVPAVPLPARVPSWATLVSPAGLCHDTAEPLEVNNCPLEEPAALNCAGPTPAAATPRVLPAVPLPASVASWLTADKAAVVCVVLSGNLKPPELERIIPATSSAAAGALVFIPKPPVAWTRN